ncbi:SpoIIAA family protein [Mucilaginibacter ginkgonis]|uniref:STAS/SEC14 domain-containing protein n=1 Tax=Mucilaginibacter ginkgonis TaxID=2682091 RepID=A0A6I4IP23_9SPHI|nr:STAS/SEC14 domain-containing protein [Mucilaginibacter ginkgonis]QQL50823.1 STAS/SEC14 domain-containing protein [Mucilaginibacter ginkgonis]
MLQFINDLPEDIVGIHAVGEVTKDEYEKVVIPRIEELVARQDKIKFMLVLETDIQKFTLGALWNDVKLGIQKFTKWNRIAIVTDQKSVEWFTNTAGLLIPGKTKGFTLAELDKAVSWISEDN